MMRYSRHKNALEVTGKGVQARVDVGDRADAGLAATRVPTRETSAGTSADEVSVASTCSRECRRMLLQQTPATTGRVTDLSSGGLYECPMCWLPFDEDATEDPGGNLCTSCYWLVEAGWIDMSTLAEQDS
ncbi:MAG: hypothetical protein ACE5HE_10655 [Phycisphaerae bacterium]